MIAGRLSAPVLFSSDVRILACRLEADPRSAGCEKIRYPVADRVLWLCPRRVAIFRSAAGGSLAGVSCVQPSLFDQVADG